MKVTVQYYDGPPINAVQIAADAKRAAADASRSAATNPNSAGAKKRAADTAAASKKADDNLALKPDAALRAAVKAVADSYGYPVTVVDGQNETIEVPNLEQAKAVMLDLSPLAPIQTQTAP